MAKSKKQKKKPKKVGGPFLAAAVFCESIMEDKAGKISAVGIMDGVAFWLSTDAPPDVPSKGNPITFMQNILIILRTGDSPGKHKLRLVMEQPSGKRSDVLNQDISLSAPLHGGCNVKTQASLSVYSSGVFLIDVILNDKRLTRMPLNVSIQRLPSTMADNAKGKKN